MASTLRIWLALGSRSELVSASATKEMSQALLDKAKAVKLYSIAKRFNFEVDTAALIAYLDTRRSIGGLTATEWITRLFLALDTLDASGMLAFIAQTELELAEIVDQRMLTSIRVQALLESEGQAARAQAVLNENRAAFSESEATLLETRIALAEDATSGRPWSASMPKARPSRTLMHWSTTLRRCEISTRWSRWPSACTNLTIRFETRASSLLRCKV
ncbi:hypothetical protein [Cupriavidus basilensis]